MNKTRADIKRKQRLLLLLLALLATAAALIYLKTDNERTADDETAQEEVEVYPVTQIDSSQVKEIGIINRGDAVNLIREGEGWIRRENEEEAFEEAFDIDSSLVEDFLARASSVTADEKIEDVDDLAEYGLEVPSVNITLQWDDNMYIIRLGDYNPIIGSYYLSINDETTVYTIDSSTYYGLSKTLEDFKETEAKLQDP